MRLGVRSPFLSGLFRFLLSLPIPVLSTSVCFKNILPTSFDVAVCFGITVNSRVFWVPRSGCRSMTWRKQSSMPQCRETVGFVRCPGAAKGKGHQVYCAHSFSRRCVYLFSALLTRQRVFEPYIPRIGMQTKAPYSSARTVNDKEQVETPSLPGMHQTIKQRDSDTL